MTPDLSRRHTLPTGNDHGGQSEVAGALEQLPALAVLRWLPMAVLAIDAASTIVYANPACAAMLGCTEATLAGRPVTEFLETTPTSPAARVVSDLHTATGSVTTWHSGRDEVIKAVVSASTMLRAAEPLLLVALTDVTDELWNFDSAGCSATRPLHATMNQTCSA